MNAALGVLRRLETTVLVVLFGAMLMLAFVQIGVRNCPGLAWLPLLDESVCRAGQPLLIWGDPMARLLVLWVALWGSMMAARDDRHIRIDVLQRYLPPSVRRITDTLANLVAAALCGVVAWYSGSFVALEYHDGFPAFAQFPAWIAELIIPFAFWVIGLRLVLHAWRSALRTEPVT